MFKTPFHRRIIPWLYVFIFLGLAPILIFYTAGYRYNPKKNTLEKNGSLIIDSLPAGAQVYLDGQSTGDTTPVTIQNVTPGLHTIRVERPGDVAWQKNLEVHAEQVTFANKIWLWHLTEPMFVKSLAISTTESSDDQGDYLAILEPGATSSHLEIFDSALESQRMIPIAAATSSPSDWHIQWHPDGRQVFVQQKPAGQGTLIEFNRIFPWSITNLPPASYIWNGSRLTKGNAESEALQSGLSIQTNTSTKMQVLVDNGILLEKFALPSGNWHIQTIKRPFVLLQDGTHWLGVELKKESPFAGQLYGDEPIWLKDRKLPTALFKHQNEIWLWELGQTPQLLWRGSDTIQQLTWHIDSQQVLFATKTEIKALDLDDRDGRTVLTLATFDQIQNIDLLKNKLAIFGERDQKQGLWWLPLD